MKPKNNPEYPEEDVDGCVNLGPRNPIQITMSQTMRVNLSHGNMMAEYDAIQRKRHFIQKHDTEPNYPPEDIFDDEVKKFETMSEAEILLFDQRMMAARQEEHAPGGGIYVRRSGSGFGSDVFGFAYHIQTGKWTTTNEHGLHAYCAEELMIEFQCTLLEILSGFIFTVEGFRTPIMNPYGYAFVDPAQFRLALVEIWKWKRFLVVSNTTDAYRWDLLTPDFAHDMLLKYQKTIG